MNPPPVESRVVIFAPANRAAAKASFRSRLVPTVNGFPALILAAISTSLMVRLLAMRGRFPVSGLEVNRIPQKVSALQNLLDNLAGCGYQSSVLKDTRHKNKQWNLGSTDPSPTWPQVQCAILMDIRDELQTLNATLRCPNFLAIPRKLDEIRSNTSKKRKRQ